MRTKEEIFKNAISSAALFFAFVLTPQVFAESKAEVGFCSASFNVHFRKSSNRAITERKNFVAPICFTTSEHSHIGLYPSFGLSIKSKWADNALHDLQIESDENGGKNTYRVEVIDKDNLGKIVAANDNKGGYVELRIVENVGNIIRIKCIDCRIVDVVKALNTLMEIQFINADVLPSEKKITLNFDSIPVPVVASILALEADVDMAQYVHSESVDESTTDEGGKVGTQATISRKYVERYIFLNKSLKE